MNENVIVNEYDFKNPFIQKTDSLVENCIRDCHIKFFQTFDQLCEYDFQLKNINNNQLIKLTNSDKSMAPFELKDKLTVACANVFTFIQINKLTKKCTVIYPI